MGSAKTLPVSESKEILKEAIKFYEKYYTSD